MGMFMYSASSLEVEITGQYSYRLSGSRLSSPARAGTKARKRQLLALSNSQPSMVRLCLHQADRRFYEKSPADVASMSLAGIKVRRVPAYFFLGSIYL